MFLFSSSVRVEEKECKEINGVVEKGPCSYPFRRGYVAFFLSLNSNCKTRSLKGVGRLLEVPTVRL